MLEVGDRFPEFELPAHNGRKTKLSDLLENNQVLVLAFYLLDFSGE